MSLNRWEQSLWDYWNREADERRFWENKIADRSRRGAVDVRLLTEDLRAYASERAQHVRDLKAFERVDAVPLSSLTNLAEYLIRVWSVLPAAKKQQRPSGDF